MLVWGGLRGSLSMVLILGLPMDFPGRHLLVNLVFGVVAISLFLQGLTMGPLMAKLGVKGGHG
ncbi:MAG: cation:proton antiporter, partial [Planctomycetota bacterium]